MAKQTRKPGRTDNKRQWQAHVKALDQSGLSRTEYCRQHDLSYHILTYWQRKLGKVKTSAQTQALVPVTFQVEPVRASRAHNCAELHIILSNEFSIAMGDNFSVAPCKKDC